YQLAFSKPVKLYAEGAHKIRVVPIEEIDDLEVWVGTSTVDQEYATQTVPAKVSYEALRQKSTDDWNNLLGQIKVQGDAERTKLFYSLLYRTLQSPYRISE